MRIPILDELDRLKPSSKALRYFESPIKKKKKKNVLVRVMQMKFQKCLLFVLFHCRRRKEKTSQVMEKLVACRVSDLFTEPLSKRHCTGSRVRAPRFQRVTIKWKANSWMSLKSAFQIIGKPQCMSHLWIGASRKSSWRHVARGGKKHQPQNKQTQRDSCSSPVCSICHGADSKHRKSADYGGND